MDALLVSASFLGWPFALFKMVAAFVTGMVGGSLVNRFTEADDNPRHESVATAVVPGPRRLGDAVHYSVFELLAAIDVWILAGVVVAALIATFIPAAYLANQTWAQGLGGMLLVLVIAIPLYVCTTGSVPIPASLIAAGMPAGTALVFLMAGPASNVVTLGVIHRVLGGRILVIYLETVILMSISLGIGFDWLLQTGGGGPAVTGDGHGASYIAVASAFLLSGLLVYLLGLRLMARLSVRCPAAPATDLTLQVEGMFCQHCVISVKKSLEGIAAVSEATPDLASGLVRVRGDHPDVTALIRAVEQAGFRARPG